MSRIAYVNGRYLPHAAAAVYNEDPGLIKADGVDEDCDEREVHHVDDRRHNARLDGT
jgi:D-alanine transaminase